MQEFGVFCALPKRHKSNSNAKGTHCCVHDSCSMSPNRISNVSDIDGVQVLVITCSFNEDLGGRRANNEV